MPDLTAVKAALRAQRIETPSWAFGNTGTRFKVFAQPGVPRTVREKIDDAAQVHRYIGIAPSVAVHIPWDAVDDYPALAAYAAGQGIRIGTVNANVFQDDDYRLGDALQQVYGRLAAEQRMLLEYKLFEPSFYTTDVPDWGTALLHCTAL